MLLTRELALAAALDAADAQMRKCGRSVWSLADYELADRTIERLWPLGAPTEALRQRLAVLNTIPNPDHQERAAIVRELETRKEKYDAE